MSFADVEIKSSGLFLKIESGKPVTIRLLQGTPYARVIHGFGKTAVNCDGKGCLSCLSDDAEFKKSKQRFKVNVYSHDSQKVMIFDFGPGLTRQFQTTEKNLKAQGLEIVDVDLIIDAAGEKEQRKYQVTPMIKSKAIPVGLVLHDLAGDLAF